MRSWRRRFCVLQGGELLYYAGEELRGIVPVRGAQVDVAPPETRGRHHAFVVRHPKRTFHAAAESAAELDGWVRALRLGATSRSADELARAPERFYCDSEDDDVKGTRPAATAAEVPTVDHANLTRAAPKRKPPTRGKRPPGAASPPEIS